MPALRSELVDTSITPYYHCVSRCVRRAFLCGEDRATGQSFEHRRGWLEDRIRLLAEVFAVDICAYAILSNHYHLVLRVDEKRAEAWKDEEVIARVGRVFSSPFADIEHMQAKERREKVARWRGRLASLSWMMRCLNEWVARRANREDDCSGRFWEGRFRSQALLDDGALLACMSYVDLNPIRAKMATSLEKADFTSIKRRLRAATVAREKNEQRRGKKKAQPVTPAGLAPMAGERARAAEAEREQLPISIEDYAALLDWTGRASRYDPDEQREQGVITGPPPELLGDTGLAPPAWLESVDTFGKPSLTLVGDPARMMQAASARGLDRCNGRRRAERMYGVAR